MTFAEWRKHNPGVWPIGLQNGAVKILDAHLSRKGKRSMFHLSDMVVSSAVSGPAYVLIPREKVE